MSDQKKVVHEIKLSTPVLVLLWFVAIGFLGKPVGNMVFPEAMAELNSGSRITVELRTPGYLDLRHHN